MNRIPYDITKYNFVQVIEDLYGVLDLSELHIQWSGAKQYELLNKVETDQLTVYHKKFYDCISSTNFYDVYVSFITDVIKPLFNEKILYQRIPTFRVHQPDNLAVAAFHSDSAYSHSTEEINFYLPLTSAWGTNTVWTESQCGKNDFRPINTNVGEVVMWDGANLLHGNKTNDTGKTRVSVDFRCLPISKYKDTGDVSVTNKTKMTIGDYWE